MGYHVQNIPRGRFGEACKIKEEAAEFADAVEQGIHIMALVELADMVGAIRGYLHNHHPDTSLDDLIAMADVTERAFKDGTRTPRTD